MSREDLIEKLNELAVRIRRQREVQGDAQRDLDALIAKRNDLIKRLEAYE